MSVSILGQVSAEDCDAIHAILSRIGDKWTVAIVAVLGDRTLRFKSLHRAIDGISQRVLTVCLRNLERDGLMVRRAYQSVPPRVEYELSPRGRLLRAKMEPLLEWVHEHWPGVQQSRIEFDAKPIKEESA